MATKKNRLGVAASEAYKDIVGQESVLRQLDFYIEAFKKSKYIPHLLLIAPKGCGKTTIARATARALKSIDNSKQGRYISCAGYNKASVEQFYNQIVASGMIDKDATFVFDECHNLSPQIQEELLSILNPNPEYQNTTSFDDREWTFDFKRISFIFATTEPHAMKEALVDRLTRVELEEYSTEHLSKIVKNTLKDYRISDTVLNDIASTLRGNARAAQKMAMTIEIYLKGGSKKTFTLEDWKVLCDTVDIKPLGLSKIELNILRVLSQVRSMRLTQLSSVTGVNRGALQKDLEIYLQKKNLITIEPSGRLITRKGIDYLEAIDAKAKPKPKAKAKKKAVKKKTTRRKAAK
tara:strand:+ start:8070 stop:9119 length:1050 start_codon:yes stop_codon:yes gene_type:complete